MSYGLEEIYAILNVPIIWVCVRIHSTRPLTHNRHPEGLLREGEREMKKHPITIVLKEDTHKALKKRAEEESRPVAQMARVIIEKELKGDKS